MCFSKQSPIHSSSTILLPLTSLYHFILLSIHYFVCLPCLISASLDVCNFLHVWSLPPLSVIRLTVQIPHMEMESKHQILLTKRWFLVFWCLCVFYCDNDNISDLISGENMIQGSSQQIKKLKKRTLFSWLFSKLFLVFNFKVCHLQEIIQYLFSGLDPLLSCLSKVVLQIYSMYK